MLVFSRRDFLKTSSLVALAPTVPCFLAQTARGVRAERDSRVLVVIQLDGGNDGVNSVVPIADDRYSQHRTVLRLAKDRLVKVNASVGLHPALADAGKLLEAGRFAIVQGVSYPNPSRSHFRSMAIWHSARLDSEEHGGIGWLGRALDEERSRVGTTTSLLIGAGPPPVAIRGRRAVASALEKPEDFALATSVDPRRVIPANEPADDLTAFVQRSMLDAYATADRLAEVGGTQATEARYPGSELGSRLRLIARLLKVGYGARVYYTLQPGYDTHSAQLPKHSQLLFELATALKAFLDDLTASRLADRVVVLMFSEFGRTVRENGSAGTDHGTSGPVFLAGPGVKAGLVGTTPSLVDLDPTHGDLKVGIDFRRVYATVLEEWLGLPAQTALGGEFERLPLFRRT
jgi:uncharacterized protein (DUF1501 family)